MGGTGVINLYLSRMVGGWSSGSAELVPGVNSAPNDLQPDIRRDERKLVFASNRSNNQSSFDIWNASKGFFN